MAKKPHRKQNPQLEPLRLKPVVAFLRAMVTGGVVMGGVSPVHANPALHQLPIASGGLPTGVTETTIGNSLIIDQNVHTVTLNWSSFDVGANASVQFVQNSSSDVAINEIHEGSASQIFGHISSNGEILLINQNGMVFGDGAVVDTGGMVASTLMPTQEAINGLSHPGTGAVLTGLANSNNMAAGAPVYAAFSANGSSANSTNVTTSAPNGYSGPVQSTANTSIDIQKGAQITAENGKPIMIFAPTISNEGTVQSNNGQVIMAAATDVVYLQEAPTSGVVSANNPSDVRGLLVEVGTGGNVKNALQGVINANQGNVTLMGFAVNQDGRITASTSINENGTIRLLANQGLHYDGSIQAQTTNAVTGQTGVANVTLGANSTTEILLNPVSVNGVETTVVASQAITPSRVEIVGGKVAMLADSQINAAAGIVNVTATQTPYNPLASGGTLNNSSIEIDSGANINVAGVNTTASMASTVISVKLQSNELADSPLQKSGALFGSTVQIDTRANGGLGTSIANITSELAAMPYTLEQRMENGGSISLNSEGTVNVQTQSTLNIAGGATTYQAGYIDTTKLISSTGQIVDIGNANPLQTYTGIYGQYSTTDAKWGVTQTYSLDSGQSTGVYEAGYVQGANAGNLNISAGNVIMNGVLQAQAVSGEYQRTEALQAAGGSLTLSNAYGSNVQDILFTNDASVTNVANLNQSGSALVLQANNLLAGSGLKTASFTSNGEISVASGSTVQLTPNSTLSLSGAMINVAGNIQGAGASVKLATSINSLTPTVYDGSVTLAKNATIDLRAVWVNDYINQANLSNAVALNINGGSFSVNASGNVNLDSNSMVDVSGGAWLQGNRTLTAGSAGSISLVAANSYGKNPGSNLSIDKTAVLNAYGLKSGGSLTLESNQVIIGGTEPSATAGPGLQPLWLSDAFFSQGGIANYTVQSDVGNLTVTGAINLVQSNTVLGGSYLTAANADNISGLTSVTTLLPNLIAPSSLTLIADNNPNFAYTYAANAGNIVVDSGASIQASNSSKINLIADNSINFDGSIVDHNGAVGMSIILPSSSSNNPVTPNYYAGQGLWLGSTANIDVSGTAVLQPNTLGLVQYNVLDGGSVALNANYGFVAALSGSQIDVSGTQAVSSVPVATSANSIGYSSENQGSNGGAVTISAAEGIYLEGTMHAQGGNAAGVLGGSLSMALQGGLGANANNPILTVTQQPVSVLTANNFSQFGDNQPAALNGRGYISEQQISTAGFSSLYLKSTANSQSSSSSANQSNVGEILFQGNLSLTLANALVLDAAQLGWAQGGSYAPVCPDCVDLTAATVTIGTSSINQQLLSVLPAPQGGAGLFNVTASGVNAAGVQQGMIVLQGVASTNGFRAVNLHAASDISMQGLLNATYNSTGQTDSFKGEFETYSKLTLTADRIYPTTLSQFSLDATSSGSIINFNANNSSTPLPVLEADGALTVSAATINQNGNLLVPFGTINLQATNEINFGANSLTSVSGQNQIIPFGITSAGQDWLYPLADITPGPNGSPVNLNLTVGGKSGVGEIPVPQKQITLNAPIVNAPVVSGQQAKIDLSGGGNLMASEFVPGSGGSKDVLAAGTAVGGGTSFALLPGYSGYAPYDPLLSTSAATISLGSGAGQMTAGSSYVISSFGNGVSINWSAIGAGKAPTVGEEFTYNGATVQVTDSANSVIPATVIMASLPNADGGTNINISSADVGGLALGEQVTIGAGSTLAAGTYTLLPAQYALLPGAYLITPQTTTAVPQGWSGTRIDGATMVSGYYGIAGTTSQSQTPAEFVVQAGSAALANSQINVTYGDSFFAKQAATDNLAVPQLAQDAGQLSAIVTTALELPTLITSGALAAKIDISANNISVVSAYDGAAGVVELLASDLKKYNIGSLFLGGVRSVDATTGNTVFNVNASTVTVNSGVTLNQASELILAANNTLEVKSGATLESVGTAGTAANTVIETGAASALLRVANGPQVVLDRSGTGGGTGNLLIDSGATLQAGNTAVSGAILLDATGNSSSLQGKISLDNHGSLTIGANALNIGDTANQTGLSGLSIDQTQLYNLGNIANLYLTGRNYIDVYGDIYAQGNTPTQIGNLVLNTPVLAGISVAGDSNAAQFNASKLTLANYSGGTCSVGSGSACSGQGSETLTFNVANLVLDATNAGGFSVSGFSGATNTPVGVEFNVGKSVTGVATGVYNFTENTVINTPVISADSAVNTTINANGNNLTIASTQQGGGADQGVGATLNLSAANLSVDSSLLYLGGNVNLNASGNLDLQSNTVIDVSASQQAAGLNPAVQIAAGEISLTSQGDVLADAGAQLLLNSNYTGIAAGSLHINAVNASYINSNTKAPSDALNNDQPIVWLGDAAQIDAKGPSSAYGGQLQMYVNSFDTSLGVNPSSPFNDLNSLATAAGFSGQFNLRLHTGDINVYNTQVVTAQTINLTADNGAINVLGTLDAAGTNGGSITLSSNSAVHVYGSLLANAQGAAGNGGNVTLSAVSQVAWDNNGQTGQFTPGNVKIMHGAVVDVLSQGDYTQANCVTLGLCGSLGSVHLLVDAQVDNNTGAILGVTNNGTVSIVPQGYYASGNQDPTNPALQPDVIAVQVYDLSLPTSQAGASDVQNQITANDVLTYQTNAANFMANLSNPSSHFIVMPGIEVITTGGKAMTVDPGAVWDLSTWRYSYGAHTNLPGELILRSSGDLNIAQSLTDGFYNTLTGNSYQSSSVNQFNTDTGVTQLQSGYSWSYDLVAGADIASADHNRTLAAATAMAANAGNVNLQTFTSTVTSVVDSTDFNVSSTVDWAVGDSLVGGGLAAGTVITGISGNTVSINLAPLTSITHNPSITAIKQIYTGTGDITVNAAGNVNMSDHSMIYTVGRQDANNAWGYSETQAENIYYVYSNRDGTTGYYAEYPVDGGNVTVNAGNSIQVNLLNSTDKLSFYTDWMMRLSGSIAGQTMPVAWGVNFENYSTNGASLGTLGGGNIIVNAGNNIDNLTVAIPTTGKINTTETVASSVNDSGATTLTLQNTTGWSVGDAISGQGLDPSTVITGINGNTITLSTATTAPILAGESIVGVGVTGTSPIVSGGGNLTVNSGGNIAGGAFYVEQGIANIVAAGSLTAGSYYTTLGNVNAYLDPILALGNAQINVIAGQNIALESVLNPLAVPSPTANANKYSSFQDSLFFTYGANSGVSLTAVSGNVTLDNNLTVLENATDIPNSASVLNDLTTYPGALTVNALQGSINVLNSFQLFPTANGNLNLYAYDNIDTGPASSVTQQVTVNLSAADPASLPSTLSPVRGKFGQGTSSTSNDPLTDLSSIAAYAQTPIHQNDNNPVLISTAIGSIESQSAQGLLFALAKQAIVSAGLDIIDTGFSIQQDTAASSSLISAGRDIVFNTARDPATGALLNAGNNKIIQVSGPGQLTVTSGRNIDLGSSAGIVSVGNTGVNSFLPNGGANLTVLAGLGGGLVNVGGFAQTFSGLIPNSVAQAYNTQLDSYSSKLTALMRDYSGNQNMTTAQALSYFAQLANNPTPSTQFSLSDKQWLGTIETQLLQYVQPIYAAQMQQYAQQRAAATLTVDKDRLELAMMATTEALYPGTTLLAGNTNYHYDPTLGWVANAGSNVSDIIKNIDVNLLAEIQAAYGNTISLGGGSSVNISAAEQTINNSPNSAYGKSLISSIFAARPDIQATIRPDKGDLSLYFSTIQTYDGGNINIQTPNGGIDAGLSASTLGQKSADQLGIIVRGAGDINAFLRNDFQVNLTRVMTLGGGSVVAGSSEGSIDAGKGVALNGAVTQQVTYDIYGNPLLTLLPAVTTSGIRSASPANSNILPGSIVLFAPRGVIDAGEAGIAGGNLYLDASSFKNVANISSTGISIGAPASAPPAGISASLSGASGLTASVNKSFESATDAVGKDSDENRLKKAMAALGVLLVDVLGFGD